MTTTGTSQMYLDILKNLHRLLIGGADEDVHRVLAVYLQPIISGVIDADIIESIENVLDLSSRLDISDNTDTYNAVREIVHAYNKALTYEDWNSTQEALPVYQPQQTVRGHSDNSVVEE